MDIDLIYCAAGNARFAQIAIDAGFKYGAQLPGTVYHPVYFADQNWKKPDRERYMKELAKHRPHMATVLDLERHEQLEEVLDWAEEAAQHVEVVCIIPKAHGVIRLLPRAIGGAEVRLAYSIPSRYGGSAVAWGEFAGWPVHLLGSAPEKQMKLSGYFKVASTDGNYAQKIALRYGQFWVPGTARYAKAKWWPRLYEADGCEWEVDAPYEAFRRSCENIMAAWRRL